MRCGCLGYYAAYGGNFLPTFRDNLSVPSSGVKKSKRELVKIDSVETIIYFGGGRGAKSNFCSYFLHLLSILGEFLYTASAYLSAERLWFSWKSFTVNHMILILKNVLVKSVYFITGQAHTICNIIVSLYKYFFLFFVFLRCVGSRKAG